MIERLPVRETRAIRSQDAADIYAEPSKEFARTAAAGVLLRLGRGYFAVIPVNTRLTPWRPDVESVALGVAGAGDGVNATAPMGVPAARALDGSRGR